jgi:very-short-patch-repair endonuclease
LFERGNTLFNLSPNAIGGEVARAKPVTERGTLPKHKIGLFKHRFSHEVCGMDSASTKSNRPSRSRRRPETTARARTLRQADNDAEAAMWSALKAKRLGGYKFVRQFPVGPYFADFLCRQRHLVVEVDGSQHVDSTQDRVRDEYMREAGFSVIRFWSADVLRQRNAVADTILAALNGRLTSDVAASDLRFVFASGEKR